MNLACFYHDKKHLPFNQEGIRYMLSECRICPDCKTLLSTRLEPEKKVVVLDREKIYQKPIREIGEEG